MGKQKTIKKGRKCVRPKDGSIIKPSFIVGIGGSAGALNAYMALLDALPPKTGMAFVFVLHMFPAANSQLAEILSRHTKMKVKVASSPMPILANHVYVISPNMDLRIESFAFKVVSPRIKGNTQIDLLFISLAEALGARAIGIVLSGYLSDGTEGCKHIKALGGITFAQDKSAEVPQMPLSAEASGSIDFVLPPEKISDELRKIGARFVHDKTLGNKRNKADKFPDKYFDKKNETVEEKTDDVVQSKRLAADRNRKSSRAKTDVEETKQSKSTPSSESSQLGNKGLIQERKWADEAQIIQREAEDRAWVLERFQKRLIAEAHIENERIETTSRLDERVRTDLAAEQSSRLLSDEKISHSLTQAALVTRDQFLAVVSHDLKNPLSTISISASLMRRQLSDEKKDVGSIIQFLDIIERNSAIMDRMISDLLDVERMANGKLVLKFEKYDICALLRECKELFASILANKSFTMTIQTGPDPIFADVDHDRVLQVLSNLIGNALKFTPNGGIIDLSAHKQANEIEISVTDNGPGISEEKKTQIFERFSQLQNRDRRGLGLGLFISKWIVEAHKGRIGVSSDVGKGSTFTVTLPVTGSD